MVMGGRGHLSCSSFFFERTLSGYKARGANPVPNYGGRNFAALNRRIRQYAQGESGASRVRLGRGHGTDGFTDRFHAIAPRCVPL